MGVDEALETPRRSGSPTLEYTTGRRSYKIASATIGPDIPQRTVPKTAAGVSDQQKHQLVKHNKLRPSSSRVQAAAYRAYGGLGSRGLQRSSPSSTIMPHFDTSTSVIHSVKGRRPSSAILGGGYHYPTSQPQIVHEKFSKRQPRYMQASFEATSDGPLLSGPHMTEAPALQRPMSAGPVPYARQVYQTNQVQASKGPEQRFSHTLPTDPAAKRIWENLTKRPYFVPPPATDRVPTRQSLSAPSSMQHRLPRPLSGHSLRSSERFTSLPVQQQLGTNAQPMTVSGYSAPEEEWAAPPASSAWWQGSRLGRTAIQTLDTRLKMAGCTTSSMPASDNQRAYVARGAQLSSLRPFQPPPHVVSDEADNEDAGTDDADGGGDDGGAGEHGEDGGAGQATVDAGKGGADNADGDDGSARKQTEEESAAGGQVEAGEADANGEGGDNDDGTGKQRGHKGAAGDEEEADKDGADGDGGDDSERRQMVEEGAGGGQEGAGEGDAGGDGGDDGSAWKQTEEEATGGGKVEAGEDGAGRDDGSAWKQTEEEATGGGKVEAGEDDADRSGDNSGRRSETEEGGAGEGTENTNKDDANGNGGDGGSARKQTEEEGAGGGQDEAIKGTADGDDEGTKKQREELVDHGPSGSWEGAEHG
eukprot:CAMPEP_0202392090 /NCGR_PEP_ID=MMETSP1127-20130417/92186_1 /ASSEMBLY_ACC=CAM_ASM_000462 /TAXON_ID=3047 /ORGANISM="Dunaliella tertiolecta, Strain CCMP1320" /LENGTH=644 /DNA_ID=CAMNT_0048994569 /DNA_START=229 /DNA_END=2163 /DNA_ORIENTATION=-